ncbi:DUF5718 family protein [Vibrio lamellibrachiae]|uniref:DUF5718 family protein n=1 Tax=Vibrio lamellibrachiae TaxID=2910253 RepID=UPI003D0A3EB6
MLSLGIIGNFLGHLSGAESVTEDRLPNGIFVIDCEHPDTLSSNEIAKYPEQGSKVDIEPEFVLRCQVSYAGGKVSALMAKQMTIGNDFTIRDLPGSEKIDQRKSWGAQSKGINAHWWDILRLSPANYGENFRLISFIERNGEMILATPEVNCTELKVFYCHLMAWMVDRINNQKDEGMYSAILPSIAKLGYPSELILYTGAPNYTPWGEKNFVQKGDKIHIAGYDAEFVDSALVKEMFNRNETDNNDYLLSFTQTVE